MENDYMSESGFDNIKNTNELKSIYYGPVSPVNTNHNHGFMSFFYCLCYPFRKKIISSDGKYWLHNVLCFDYTTDGKECIGLNENTVVDIPIDRDEIKPDCFFCVWFCCGLVSKKK
jgi:hypothetical protein